MAGGPMRQRPGGKVANGTTDTTSNDSNNKTMYGKNGGYHADIEGGMRRGRAAGSDANAGILEQQNNDRINELSEHVSRLKGLTIEIGNEVREQNSLLDNMSDGFQNTRDMLQGSLRRIGTMLEQGGAKHMCYMVAFCVLIMLFLWWLMSARA